MYIFVYGTLKRGFRNHGLLRGQQFVQEAETLPLYRLYNCGSYPGLVECRKGGDSIEGEIWRVEEEAIPKLDRLEGVPYLYQRVELRMKDFPEPVEGYIYQREVSRLADCGRRWTTGS